MEEFFTLKEIMSLDTKMGQHRHIVEEELKRLERLELTRQTREREYARYTEQEEVLKRELQAEEKVLAQAQQRIEFLATQENQITTAPALLAWEHECKDVRTKVADAESKTFQLMMDLEKTELSLKETKTFLMGLQQSFDEIKAEVAGINKLENDKIKIIQERKDHLLLSLPSHFQRSYQKALAKHLKDLVFSWAENGSCVQCFYQLSSLDCQKIETGELIDNCKGCTRLFLPNKVVKNQ